MRWNGCARSWEGLKAAETGDGASKVTRLPRRPRRMTEEPGERPHKTWRSEGPAVYDPAPTRPVQRSELQRETGWWPVDPGRAQHPAPEPDTGRAEHDGNVVDFGAARRKRTGDDAPAPGIRRIARPRRISSNSGEGPENTGRRDDPHSPPPGGPPRQT
ncbi:hypothetical protein [Nocardia crassostreae]|uniref:hypothetical protein n=1 Tax=Nocardia crassostreae TaxID=53428 RepID=UPI000A596BBD|nr:hypothetical protein [Nocardia crassostreae]